MEQNGTDFPDAEDGLTDNQLAALPFSDHAVGQGAAPPDPLVLLKTLIDAGFYMPTAHRALQYLDQCQRVALPPDRHSLLRLLLPPPS